MTIPAPADSRNLGMAHYAARAVLEHVLKRYGLTFQEQVTLRAAVSAEAELTPDDLVARVHATLKADPASVRGTIGDLESKKFLGADGAHVRPTEEGRRALTGAAAEIAPLSARIWAGIPAEDLATAGRVLAHVTERANAELATLTD